MQTYLSLAEQLRILFEVRRHPDGRPFTLQEVGKGTGIGVATLSQMRRGHIQNPQLNTVRALCQFFNMPLIYFETATSEECFSILQAENTNSGNDTNPPGNNEIAFRAGKLSKESQEDILTIIRWLRNAESAVENGTRPPLPRLHRDEAGEEA